MDEQEKFSIDYALNRNTINLFGTIDSVMAHSVISQMQYLDDRFKREETPLDERIITLQINGPGGNVADGLAIYDTMNYVDAKIRTVGLGICASMSAFLLSSGTRGLRQATENCEILIHQPLGCVSGQASDIIIEAERIGRTRDKLNRILAENTGKNLRRIRKDTDRDNAMSAAEAQAYGLIDVVIPSKNKAKESKND